MHQQFLYEQLDGDSKNLKNIKNKFKKQLYVGLSEIKDGEFGIGERIRN